MLFHSQLFVLAFLPITVALYYALASRQVAREWLLIAASLFFYAYWDVRFLPLLLAQTLIAWGAAELALSRRTRWPLYLAVTANLAVLGLYKYLDFGIAIAEDATGLTFARADLILPIGISFYTFQIVSYLVDVARALRPAEAAASDTADASGDASAILGSQVRPALASLESDARDFNKVRYGLRRFALFVVLFPQLIAGPIVRHNEIVPQFDLDPLRDGVAERIAKGLTLFVMALVLKVYVADRIAGFVDPVYADAAQGFVPFNDAGIAVLGFGLQIFFDFAAYSEMAIGIAMMLGFTLPMNFNQPYRATSLRDFWRRWHMTLSRFLRDYLYIPLGGSRAGPIVFVWATLITMALCGLWHGAGWTFIVWGVAHGIGLIVCRAWGRFNIPLPAVIGWLLTFSFAVILFAVFRAPDFATATHLLTSLFAPTTLGDMPRNGTLILLAVGMGLALAPKPALEIIENWQTPRRWAVAAVSLAAVLAILEVGRGQPESFIYFQF